MKIRIYYDDTGYRLKDSRKSLEFMKKVIRGERKSPGDLSFIMTNDKRLVEINKEFLKRNNYTDVIAFDYSVNNIVNGEIYISIDTVKRNALNYKVSLRKEVIRVMIHGILHLCGYKDKKNVEKIIMRSREEKWLKLFGKNDEIRI